MQWEPIWKQVNVKLHNITNDDNDKENLHKDNDAKTIKLLEHYRDLGTIMSKTKWDPKDYADRIKHIDAIMDFDCNKDEYCETMQQFFIQRSGIVHRKPIETVTPHVYNAQRMNFDAPKSNMMIGLGGRKASKKSSRKTKSRKYRKSKKTKSRRH